MQFPHISNISQFRPVVENENFLFRESNGNIVSFYMIQGQDTFDGEHAPFRRESRGIVFDAATGNIVSRPLHKFFNVMEKSFTHASVIPWQDVARIMVKRDGSMVHPIKINGEIIMKTKKTHTSKEAIAATEFMKSDVKFIKWVSAVMDLGHTPIFEFTSPNFPIVVHYKNDELTVLHIRNNVTGEYYKLCDYAQMFGTPECPFPFVEDVSNQFKVDGIVSWDALFEWSQTAQNVEGVVVQMINGEMYKVKTKWYQELHRSIVFIRERDVAKVALSDGIDDLVSAFRMCGRPEATVQQVLDIQKRVLEEVKELEHYCIKIAESIPQDADRRTAYQSYAANSKYPSLVMNIWLGKPNDYVEVYRKNVIPNWSLNVIVDISDD